MLPPRPYPAVTCVSAYRPPGSTAAEKETWIDGLTSALAKIMDLSPVTIVCGDMNLCLREEESSNLRNALTGLDFCILNDKDIATHGRRTI